MHFSLKTFSLQDTLGKRPKQILWSPEDWYHHFNVNESTLYYIFFLYGSWSFCICLILLYVHSKIKQIDVQIYVYNDVIHNIVKQKYVTLAKKKWNRHSLFLALNTDSFNNNFSLYQSIIKQLLLVRRKKPVRAREGWKTPEGPKPKVSVCV